MDYRPRDHRGQSRGIDGGRPVALDHCEQYVPDPETAGLQPYPFLRARQEMAGLCPAGDHEDGLCDGQDRGVVLLGIPGGTGGSRIKDDTVEANAVPVRCP